LLVHENSDLPKCSSEDHLCEPEINESSCCEDSKCKDQDSCNENTSPRDGKLPSLNGEHIIIKAQEMQFGEMDLRETPQCLSMEKRFLRNQEMINKRASFEINQSRRKSLKKKSLIPEKSTIQAAKDEA
jgi:hypothetical protein